MYVFVYGELKSVKFEFVVEMAYIFAFTRILDLFERLAMLVKLLLLSDDLDIFIFEVVRLEVYKFLDNFW